MVRYDPRFLVKGILLRRAGERVGKRAGVSRTISVKALLNVAYHGNMLQPFLRYFSEILFFKIYKYMYISDIRFIVTYLPFLSCSVKNCI